MTTSARTRPGDGGFSRLPTDVDGFDALAELALGIAAERKPLESIAAPLSSVE